MKDLGKCLFCGSRRRSLNLRANDRFLDLPGDHDQYRCSECGLLYIDPQPDLAELERHYPTNYPSHHDGDDSTFRKYVQIYRDAFGPKSTWFSRLRIAPYRHAIMEVPGPLGTKLLDIGCGSGYFLTLVKEALGFDVLGVDPFSDGDSFAKEHGVKVLRTTLEESNLPCSSFDIVTLNNVLEHVPDPRGTIRESRRLLKPGGRLVVTGPNSASLIRYLFGRHWANLDIPRHLAVPSITNLRQVGESEGFRLSKIRHWGSSGHLIMSVLYALKQKQPTNLPRKWILAGLPFAYFINALHLSDEVEMTFVKF